MNGFGNFSKPITWLAALLLAAFVAGCGGGGGGGAAAPGAGAGAAVLPGVAGTAGAAATNPTVISSNPSNNAINVPTSTSGPGAAPVVSGTLVTATFNAAMDPATIVSPLLTFTLRETVAGTNVPGTVTMNAANTIATFTPIAVALTANTKYTATVTTAAKNAGGTAMPNTVAWSFTTSAATSTGQSSPNIGTASTYGVFASAAAVTLAVDSIVNGDVGLNPAGACNNCVIGTTVIGGVINNGGALAVQAQTDFGAAYAEASTRATNACTLSSPADISAAQAVCVGFTPATPGPTYGPGLYRTANPIGFTGTITLDAGGNPDAVFIFQTDSALTTATNSTVVLANGALARNVWWIVGSAATLGVTSTFKGTIIANGAAISVLNGIVGVRTLVEGRLFSSSAAVGVDEFATVTVPQ